MSKTWIQILSGASFGKLLPDFDQATVKSEPMLYNCSGNAARKLGGPITRAFLDALPDRQFGECVVDTRVHMLMPRWYPCIPGWHHDDVPRRASDGQPEYLEPEYRAEHAMAIVGAPVSRTKFAVGAGSFELPESGKTVYAEWHREVSRRVKSGELRAFRVPMRRVVFFDWNAWHRGVRSTGAGWRWFGRASIDTGRIAEVTNEIRTQVQVYLSPANEGW